MNTVIRRVVSVILALFLFTIIIFWATETLPGDAASHLLGQEATPEGLAILRHKLGLDQPAYLRYLDWVSALLHGDFGTSYTWNVPVAPMIARRLVNSLLLAGLTLVVSIPLAILLGTLAGKNQGGRLDNLISYFAVGLYSIPEFVTGIFLIMLFSVSLKILPATSSLSPEFELKEWMTAAILPSLTLTLATIAYTVRLVRSSLIETLKQEYIVAARARGLPEKTVILKHALLNAAIPVVPAIGIYVGWMIGGLILTETVFAYPGIGSLLATGIANRDVPVIQATSILVYLGYTLASFATDFTVALLDPRTKGGAQ